MKYPAAKEQLYQRRLAQSFLLAGVRQEAAAALLADASWQIANFAKGQPLYGGGLWQGYLGLMISGKATAYSAPKEGAAILRSFGAGDVFGAANLYAEGAEAFSHIVADQATEVLFLPRASLQRLLSAEPQAAENYLRFLAHRVAFLNRKIQALTAGAATDRLAAYLATYSQPDDAGRAVLAVNISKLAPSLSMSRASLYRSLQHLVDRGAIYREGRQVVIADFAKLQQPE